MITQLNYEGTSRVPPVNIAVLPVDLLSPSGGFAEFCNLIPSVTLKEI